MSCFEACWKLSPDMRPTLTLEVMRTALREMKKLRRVQPTIEVMCTLCRLFIEECIRLHKFPEAVKSLVPWFAEQDGDNSEIKVPEFCEKEPCFSVLTKMIGADESLQSTLAKEVADAFYSNNTLDLFAAPHEPDGSADPPSAFARALLDQYINSDDTSILGLPVAIVTVVDDILKSCRALITLTDPTPGVLGSSYGDTSDVFSEELGSPSLTQVTFASAARRSALWKSRIFSYWSEAGDDGSIAPEYARHLSRWTDADPGFAMDEVDRVLGDIEKWTKKLRPRACDVLLSALTRTVRQAWADLGSEISQGESPVRHLVMGLAKYTKDKSVLSIRSSLLSQAAQSARDGALARALGSLESWSTDLSLLPAILEDYRVVEDFEKHEALTQVMYNFRGFLAKRLLEWLPTVQGQSAENDRMLHAPRLPKKAQWRALPPSFGFHRFA